MKLAVVLFNLGGPDCLAAVEPFLRKLFGDPAIIAGPPIIRIPLAWLIARQRAPVAREIYAKIGGRSPILEETKAQGRALEAALATRGLAAQCFIAMRYAKPFADEAVRALKEWGADRIVLLPLYPQFSTTTTASSLADWRRAAAKLETPQAELHDYPRAVGFIEALATQVRQTLAKAKHGLEYRLLLSAHGLPKRIVARGDPYPGQVAMTASALVDCLGIKNLDWVLCYQSRVGPLAWIGPATDDEIRKAAAEGKGIVVAPIAFVSEHSETLVELDIEYAALAREAGARDYLRAPAVGTHPAFIDALAELVMGASQ